MVKKKKSSNLRIILKIILFIILIPFYVIRSFYYVIQKIFQVSKKAEIGIKRRKITSKYEDFEVVEQHKGNYKKWITKVYKSESQIGIILGARGTGKSAIGIKILENVHAKHKKKCYAMGFQKEKMPHFIEVVDDIKKIKNNSFVLIDEGGILFSSRKSMSNANKILSELILVARHKNLNIIFISQNSSNLDVNILRQADYLILKPSSLLQKEFERNVIQKIYEEVGEAFEKLEEKIGITYIYSSHFRGFVSNPLPSFWNTGISKGFK